MWKVVVRGLLSHKIRLSLTALSIVLGVGFVVGTFVLTDTIERTFSDLFTQTTKGVDVAVRTKQSFNNENSGEQRAPLPATVLDQIKDVPGVQVAEGTMFGYAQFVAKDGKPITTGGAPTLGVSVNESPELQSATIRQGRQPDGPNDVAMDAHTAEKYGFAVGDRVPILLQGPPREFTITAIVGFGSADNLAGATLAAFDQETAKTVLNREDKYDEIDVVAAPGVTPEQLRDRVAATVGPDYQTLTGTELVEENVKAVGQFTKFINYALLVFAFVALFVGSFIIVNTFSIILAQRTRELAMLRCVGASRRQVLGSVLAEALIIGLIAAVVGLGVGLLTAMGLRAAFSAVGAELPTTALVVKPRTIVIGLIVGVVVTLLASVMPALRAVRVPPVTALQDRTVTVRSQAGWLRTTIGALTTAAGVGLLLLGLFVDQGNRLVNVGVGAVVIFLGVGILSPLVARPLARLLGWPFARWAGEPGRIARGNAMRNPRRTASTAAALMIGLALVSMVTIFAASIKSSVTKILDESVAADYILTGSSNSAQGFSPEVVTRLAEQGEIASAAGIRLGVAKIDGVDQQLAGVDPIAYDASVRTETTAGRLRDLANGGIAVRENLADQHGWHAGDTLTLTFPVGGTAQVPIKAIYKDNQLNGPILLALTDYQRHYADQLDIVALVKARSGVSAADSRAAVERVVNDFPNVQVKDQAQYKQEQYTQINQILVFFYLLLALSVIIAFIGIVNTLALSVLERIRELGLLRALGMTKAQLRAMIRWEAVIIAVLGALLGLVVGTFFGWTLVRSLQGQGITTFSLPVGSLIVFVVAAAIAGVLAAIFPGMRAARLDILRAITTE
jgi:putative ABC transport system permease protein